MVAKNASLGNGVNRPKGFVEPAALAAVGLVAVVGVIVAVLLLGSLPPMSSRAVVREESWRLQEAVRLGIVSETNNLIAKGKFYAAQARDLLASNPELMVTRAYRPVAGSDAGLLAANPELMVARAYRLTSGSLSPAGLEVCEDGRSDSLLAANPELALLQHC